MKKEKETITGEISAIKFRNAEGWAVFSLQGKGLSFTGTLAAMVDIGTEVACTGKEETNKWGKNFKCEQIVPAAPDVSTELGVIKLLQRLPGIGPKKAMAAVGEHGHVEAWSIALKDPCRIGVKKEHEQVAITLATSLIDSYEATVYLLGIGLTDYQAGLIHSLYGSQTIKQVSENPYDLLKVDGFGFVTVFKIAIKAGISVGSDSTIYACIKYVLEDGQKNNGHIWLSGWVLCDVVIETLNKTAMEMEIPIANLPTEDRVRKCCHYMSTGGSIIINKGRVFSKKLYTAETKILDFLRGGQDA